jgi:hypothetical protein
MLGPHAGACSASHKLFGKIGSIGPNLTSDNNHQVRKPLENIINLNALVPVDYRVSVSKFQDGRILTNKIPEQNERAITVQSQVERFAIEREKQVYWPLRERTGTLSKCAPDKPRTVRSAEMRHPARTYTSVIAYLLRRKKAMHVPKKSKGARPGSGIPVTMATPATLS